MNGPCFPPSANIGSSSTSTLKRMISASVDSRTLIRAMSVSLPQSQTDIELRPIEWLAIVDRLVYSKSTRSGATGEGHRNPPSGVQLHTAALSS